MGQSRPRNDPLLFEPKMPLEAPHAKGDGTEAYKSSARHVWVDVPRVSARQSSRVLRTRS